MMSDYVPPELRGERPAEPGSSPSDDGADRLVDGQRIADVLAQDEDAAFERHMRASFGVDSEGRPAEPSTSHIAAEAGVYATPAEKLEPDPDRDPDTHAGVRPFASSDELEERAVEEYLQATMPGYTPQS